MTTSSCEQERSFGLSVGGVCALLAAVGWWRHHHALAAVWAAVSVALVVPAVTKPALLRVPSAWWWRLAGLLGWINARVLLSALFFAMVTPIGVVMRLTGHDPLRRRGAARSTNWLPYAERLRDPRHYERMY